MEKAKIIELPMPEIQDLEVAINNTIQNYVNSENKKGRKVSYAYLVGILEYTKENIINKSYDI